MTSIPVPQGCTDGTLAGPWDGRDDPLAPFLILWSILRRRVLAVLGCALTVVTLVAAYTYIARPMYEASASIRIDDAGFRTLSLSAAPSASELPTEMEILRSRALAEDVVTALALRLRVTAPRSALRSDLLSHIDVSPSADVAEYELRLQPDGRFAVRNCETREQVATVAPGESARFGGISFTLAPTAATMPKLRIAVQSLGDAADALGSMIRVEPAEPDANIVELRGRDADPQLLRDMLNTTAARYLARRAELRAGQARGTAQMLESQLDTLTAELAASQRALGAFRQDARAVDPTAEARVELQRLAAMRLRRDSLDVERAALAKLLAEIDAAAQRDPREASLYRRLVGFPTLLRTRSVSELLRSLTAAEDRLAILGARRTAEDPDVQALAARARELQQQLHLVATTYLEALTNQVAEADRSLVLGGEQLARLPATEIQLAQLQRRPAVLEGMYRQVLIRLQEARIAEAANEPGARVIDAAVAPAKPFRPRPFRNLALGLAMGLLAGVAVALGSEFLDQSVHSRSEVQLATGVSVLGVIPRMSWRAGAGGAPPSKRMSELLPAAEAYERLQTNVLHALPRRVVKTIVVTSPLPGDGKTTTATNLALSIARRGSRVLLIDADLRRGAIDRVFGAAREPGLTNVWSGSSTLEGALHTLNVGGGSLHYLTSGALPAFPKGVIASNRMRALLDRLAHAYDVIVIDSPPLNVVVDAAELAKSADGVLVVARAGITAPQALAYTVEQLRNVGAPTLGTVLNDVDIERDVTYDDAYLYYALPSARYYASAK